MKRAILAICAFGLCSSLAIPAASADDAVLKWQVANQFPEPLQIGFYVADRGVGWQYSLAPNERRVFRLQCVAGETVCFGASPVGKINVRWGVGATGSFPCTDCCVTCGGEPPRIWTLKDPESLYDAELVAYADCNARSAANYAGREGDAQSLGKAAEIACGEEKHRLTDAIAGVSGVAESVGIVSNLEQLAAQNNAGRIEAIRDQQGAK